MFISFHHNYELCYTPFHIFDRSHCTSLHGTFWAVNWWVLGMMMTMMMCQPGYRTKTSIAHHSQNHLQTIYHLLSYFENLWATKHNHFTNRTTNNEPTIWMKCSFWSIWQTVQYFMLIFMITIFIGMINYKNENARHAVNELLSAHGEFKNVFKMK